MKRTKTAWRIVARHVLTHELRDVALVYNQHLALRLKRYAAPWIGLDEKELLDMFEVQLEGEQDD